jgi:type VI protein secretion system component Hcp
VNGLTTAFGATTRNGIELLVGQFDDAALWVDSAIGHGLLLWKKMTLLLSPSRDCDA